MALHLCAQSEHKPPGMVRPPVRHNVSRALYQTVAQCGLFYPQSSIVTLVLCHTLLPAASREGRELPRSYRFR